MITSLKIRFDKEGREEEEDVRVHRYRHGGGVRGDVRSRSADFGFCPYCDPDFVSVPGIQQVLRGYDLPMGDPNPGGSGETVRDCQTHFRNRKSGKLDIRQVLKLTSICAMCTLSEQNQFEGCGNKARDFTSSPLPHIEGSESYQVFIKWQQQEAQQVWQLF